MTIKDTAEDETRRIYHHLSQGSNSPMNDTKGIKKLFEQSPYAASHENIGYYNQIKHYVSLMLIAIVQNTVPNERTSSDTLPMRREKDDYRFKMIKEYIRDNMERPIMTNDVAAYVHLSERQLARIIKKRRG